MEKYSLFPKALRHPTSEPMTGDFITRVWHQEEKKKKTLLKQTHRCRQRNGMAVSRGAGDRGGATWGKGVSDMVTWKLDFGWSTEVSDYNVHLNCV